MFCVLLHYLKNKNKTTQNVNYNLFKLKLQKVVRPYTFLEEKKEESITNLRSNNGVDGCNKS